MAIYPPIKKIFNWQLWNDKITPQTGGGAAEVIEIFYNDLVIAMNNGTLTPGATYKILLFNQNMPDGGPTNPYGYLPVVLYDDGTNAGITIYMQALSTIEMATSGYGEFYNPNYLTGSSYNNIDGTGLYGIWDGDNPDPLEVPAYQVNDVVYWGGYAWVNISGNVGNVISITELSSDWVKLPFANTSYYTMVVDEIKVDWTNGILVERYNPENQIRVTFNAAQFDWWMGLWPSGPPSYSPISVMAWGLYSKIPQGIDSDFYGISNLEVINSHCQTVNFKGKAFLNSFISSSYFFNNYIGKNSYIDNITMHEYSDFMNNVITNGSEVYMISMNRISRCSYNDLSNGSFINHCALLLNGVIYLNNLSNSQILYNTLSQYANIESNQLDDSAIVYNDVSIGNISFNSLVNTSYIENNKVINSGIGYNNLDDSNITFNYLYQGSSISNSQLSANSTIFNNTLTSGSVFTNMTLSLTDISTNTMINSIFNLTTSGTLTGYAITKTQVNSTIVSADLSLANTIFEGMPKTIFTRKDATARLMYYDTTDTPTIVNVDN